MQRRIPQLRYAVVVTSFIATLVALAAFLAVSTTSGTPTARVAARTLSQPSTVWPIAINEAFDSLTPLNEYFELYNTSLLTNPVTLDLWTFVVYNKDDSTSLSGLSPNLRFLGPGTFLAIGPRDFVSPTRTSLFGTTGFAGAGDFLALMGTGEDVPTDVVNWGTPSIAWPNFRQFSPYFFPTRPYPIMPAPDGSNSLSRYPNGVAPDDSPDWRSLPQSPGFANQLPTATATPSTPTPTGTCLDSFEPDNTRLEARVILQNTQQVHTLCRSDGEKDYDWVRFGAAANKVYIMQTQDLAASVDTVITLYNAAGQVLAQNDDAVPGQSLASRIEYVFGVDGTYFLQTTDKSSNGAVGFQYTLALISTGQLPSTATVTPTSTFNPNAPTVTPTPGVCLDAYEPDGIPSEASLLNINTSQSHTFCPFGDVDWVKFFAKAGKAYTLRTSNLSSGVDTFVFLFNGDSTSILAQNDDGSDGGLTSRIDFFPLQDNWYTAQFKNAGEIGGTAFGYEVSLSVVSGVPAPPYSATPVVPLPPEQNTSTPGVATPTRAATLPPVATPTLSGGLPTPTPRPTVQSVGNMLPEPQPAPQQDVWSLTQGAGEIDATSSGNGQSGEKPLTGQIAPANSLVQSDLTQPLLPVGASQFAPMLFRIFYDRNLNESYDRSEGVKGIHVYFLNQDAGMTLSGQLVTSDAGTGNLMLPVLSQRIFVPYLGININLSKFPEREVHSLWLQPVKFPDRVP